MNKISTINLEFCLCAKLCKLVSAALLIEIWGSVPCRPIKGTGNFCQPSVEFWWAPLLSRDKRNVTLPNISQVNPSSRNNDDDDGKLYLIHCIHLYIPVLPYKNYNYNRRFLGEACQGNWPPPPLLNYTRNSPQKCRTRTDNPVARGEPELVPLLGSHFDKCPWSGFGRFPNQSPY